jgi:hypothetical protein
MRNGSETTSLPKPALSPAVWSALQATRWSVRGKAQSCEDAIQSTEDSYR